MRHKWEISAASSFIEFSFKYYEIGLVKGNFKRFDGEIFAGNLFDNPEISVRLDADSVSTHNRECDHRLMSSAFLSTRQFPLIVFHAFHGCRLSAGGIQELTGDLTIRNVTNKITLLVTFSEIKNLRKEISAQFALTTSFFLSDYGFESGEGVFGNQINVIMRLILIAHQQS
jgi:polyisoprenoid-binding protein YceI